MSGEWENAQEKTCDTYGRFASIKQRSRRFLTLSDPGVVVFSYPLVRFRFLVSYWPSMCSHGYRTSVLLRACALWFVFLEECPCILITIPWRVACDSCLAPQPRHRSSRVCSSVSFPCPSPMLSLCEVTQHSCVSLLSRTASVHHLRRLIARLPPFPFFISYRH